MKLAFKIAKRFLRSSIGQTILIIFGIAIGVSVQVFIGSLIQGLQKSLVDKTIGNSPQITINSTSDSKSIEDYESLETQILQSDERIQSISPANDHAAFLSYGDNSQSILVRGLDLIKADGIYKYIDRIKIGNLPEKENEILLGIDLMELYSLKLGSEILLTTPSGTFATYQVVGFFDLQVASINNNWAITSLKNSYSLFGNDSEVTSIELQVSEDSVFDVDLIQTEIESVIGQKQIKVTNWKEQNEQLLSGLSGQSISSLMIQVFVMISVVLGIASVLAITVIQKSKQIGILKAMGIKNSTASLVFLFEGMILGFFGAVLGVLLGLLLSLAFTTFALNPDGTPVIALYISYPFIGLSGAIAVIASLFASFIPALRSSKLDPIEIIRNN